MTLTIQKRVLWPLAFGIGGSTFLALLYFGIVSIAESPQHAFEFFLEDSWIILPIIVGFGIQSALYIILRKQLFIPVTHMGASGTLTGAGGATSTLAMIACCAHHVVDVLPILGLTAAATFLAKYQTLFMIISLGTTLFGIVFMLRILDRERKKVLLALPEASEEVKEQKLTRWGFAIAGLVMMSVLVGVLITKTNDASAQVLPTLPSTDSTDSSDSTDNEDTNYPLILEANEQNTGLWSENDTQIDQQGAVVVEITPINLNSPGQTLNFDVALNTHSVDLSMDLASLAALTSPNGLNLTGTNWDGPSGGHHVSGILSFELSEADLSLLEEADQLTIVILNIDAPERIFNWVK